MGLLNGSPKMHGERFTATLFPGEHLGIMEKDTWRRGEG